MNSRVVSRKASEGSYLQQKHRKQSRRGPYSADCTPELRRSSSVTPHRFSAKIPPNLGNLFSSQEGIGSNVCQRLRVAAVDDHRGRIPFLPHDPDRDANLEGEEIWNQPTVIYYTLEFSFSHFPFRNPYLLSRSLINSDFYCNVVKLGRNDLHPKDMLTPQARSSSSKQPNDGDLWDM